MGDQLSDEAGDLEKVWALVAAYTLSSQRLLSGPGSSFCRSRHFKGPRDSEGAQGFLWILGVLKGPRPSEGAQAFGWGLGILDSFWGA